MRKLLKRIFVTFGLSLAGLPAAQAETLRVTVLGDSLVQGYGLPQGEGLVPQLQAWLVAQGADVALTNAGVSGDTTAGGVSRIDWTLADQPQGLIVLLGGNDLLRGLPPTETRANLEEIVTRAQGAGVEVMLIGMQAPLNYGVEFKAEFDSIYSDLAEEHDLILHPAAFLGIIQNVGTDPAAAGAYMQADGIHPNAKGVALNVAAMGPAVQQFLAKVAEGS
ncbi:arylesterase [Arenibacterium sp. LLYu02]|uniref:arylesterase n=1 Tax=Arenibacterium sp. LLYu02 TaxID=3404132 RepID=UPI003B21C0B5